ncbi:hypothetical protein HU200_004167 [Digitaria exilis]|uniref:Uncharacterized protein n=1 Tax=Digitaria exilis TaxID=1010633 RepID=A0A835FV02_9POAL|nr:hypothetical protein HU200_004167 [Digitaria exilis]
MCCRICSGANRYHLQTAAAQQLWLQPLASQIRPLTFLLDISTVELAAVEEGIVGDGCTLLRLASKVDSIIESLENDKQQVDEPSHHV